MTSPSIPFTNLATNSTEPVLMSPARRMVAPNDAWDASLSLLVESLPAAVAIFDNQSRLLASSQKFERDYLTNPSIPLDVTGDISFPQASELWRISWNKALAGHSQAGEDDELSLLGRASGRRIHWHLSPRSDSQGAVCGVTVWFQDVTLEKALHTVFQENKDAIDDLHCQLDALRQALDAHAIVVAIDCQGCITHVNSRFCQISGYGQDELLGAPYCQLNADPQADEDWRRAWLCVTSGQNWQGELAQRAKDGSVFWTATTLVPWKDHHGTVQQFVSIRTDITERKRYENELILAARIDKLTGLPNRSLLIDRLQRAIDRSLRLSDYHFAVMFLDFDRFKIVNDSLGHEMGDLLLQGIAERLKSSLRATDTIGLDVVGNSVARLGGDEFVVILDGISGVAEATAVADRLLKQFEKPFAIGDQDLYTTASIGIVFDDGQYEHADQILRDVDTAMYSAKSAGKACFKVFDDHMRAVIKKRAQIENDLRRGLELNQFRVLFQPIVHIHSGALKGVEALIRWEHPQHGLISPADFLPIAEETGLIVPIGSWVLQQSCAQLAAWQAQFGSAAPTLLNVNLSRRQLNSNSLIGLIDENLKKYGIAPACLQLEITESTVMDNFRESVQLMKNIKSLGVKFAVDDFGTGYSCLAALKDFPVDTLKIDRAFIKDIDHSVEMAALVHAIITLANNLGLAAVAEGIETPEQQCALKELGCVWGQGYLFGKPMSHDQIEKLISSKFL